MQAERDMRIQVDFVDWGGGAGPADEFPSIGQARRHLGLSCLERDRDPDLLESLGLGRAYSRATLDGVWLAYPKRPEPPPREFETEGRCGDQVRHEAIPALPW